MNNKWIDERKNVSVKYLTDGDLAKGIEYYEYWLKYGKQNNVKTLSEKEIDWLKELKEEYERRLNND